jgi:hypothetical protein
MRCITLVRYLFKGTILEEFVNSRVSDPLHIRAYISVHQTEMIWGAIFAIIAGAIYDVLNFRSRVFAGIRRVKNKWSERSAARLRKRIKVLEVSRDWSVASLSSDKLLYLTTFRVLFIMLIAMAGGLGISVLLTAFPSAALAPSPVFCYAFAVVIGVQGVRFSLLDTRAKITERVTELESEIAGLERKLKTMTK